MKILLRSRRRKWAEIPFKINATLPLLYSAAANRDTEAVRAYMLDGGLFSRELLPYLRPMAGGYTLGLVCEVLVPPITDEAVSEFMPHVFSAKSISPVPLLDEDLVQLLNLVTNRPARIAWKHDPNAFEVRDLAGLVGRRFGYRPIYVDSKVRYQLA